jgi:hypothetical protein
MQQFTEISAAPGPVSFPGLRGPFVGYVYNLKYPRTPHPPAILTTVYLLNRKHFNITDKKSF